MKKIEGAPWDSAEVLDTPEAVEEYLAAAFETEDPMFIAKARGVVARSRTGGSNPSPLGERTVGKSHGEDFAK